MKNVPKVLQNRPQSASRKGFSTPSKPYQKGRQATYEFQQPSFPKHPIQHALPLQPTAQQTGKARSNGQKAQKARFHRRNTGAGGSRKADGNRFLSEKDMYAEKQTGKYTTRLTRLPTAVQTNRHHLSHHPPAARYLFHPMVHSAASAIAAQCIDHCSALRWALQRSACSTLPLSHACGTPLWDGCRHRPTALTGSCQARPSRHNAAAHTHKLHQPQHPFSPAMPTGRSTPPPLRQQRSPVATLMEYG